MLEIFDQNPSSRVFHVDSECYILYLGAHWDDYKPFLRLGTSPNLPDGLPPIVSTIVVPDVLTGSPLDETASLKGDATGDTHYVGDVRTVNKLRKYLNLEKIPVEGLKKADRETDDNRNAFVYSYGDGNLKIKYHKSELFDLHRRERQDAHFVARAQSIKNDLGRGPFKFPSDSYQKNGFVVAGGTAYLVARGEIAALGLPDDYFSDLAAAGVDPDRISTASVQSVDTALLRFFKRCRVKTRAPRLATASVDDIKALAGIFRANSLPALKVSFSDPDAFSFHRFAVKRGSYGFTASISDLSGPIVLGSGKTEPGAALSADIPGGTLRLSDRKLPLLPGCLYQISNESLSRTLISERYLPEKNYPFRDMLSSDENALIDQIAYYFSELFSGRDTGKVVRTIRSNRLVRELGRGAALNPVTAVYLANVLEYTRFLKVSESKSGKDADSLESVLSRHALKPDQIPSYLPIAAEISQYENEPYLFYRFLARITEDRVGFAEQISEKIRSETVFDFDSERNRLAELVAGLANPEQMEEARLRRIAERKKSQPTQVKPPAATAVQDKTADSDQDAAERRAGSKARRTRRRRSGGPWRWLLPVLIILVLLALLATLLVTGTIRNPWFGQSDQTTTQDADSTGSDDGQTPDGTGTGSDAADGTGADDAATDATDGTGADDAATGDDTGETSTTGGSQTSDQSDTADGTDGSTSADGLTTDDAGDQESTATGDGVSDTTAADDGAATATEPELPEGWPPETIPALEALRNTPGVIITPDRVVGPGGIEITVLDIINLVNRIATENGYAPMHAIDPDRPDPDWIYPNNVFVMPNATRYTVVEGDTLWDITVRYMVARLAQDYTAYVGLVEEYEDLTTTDGRRNQIESRMETIGDESHSENFSKLVIEKLSEWRD